MNQNFHKFDNIKSELKDNVWAVFYRNTKKYTYIERSVPVFRQFEIIKEFQSKFGFKNTLDYEWCIKGSDLHKLINDIVKNDKKYSNLFQVKRFKGSIKDMNREKFLKMINKYLKAWGMNKIVCLKRIKKQTKGKREWLSHLFEYGFKNEYNLTYQDPPAICLIKDD